VSLGGGPLSGGRLQLRFASACETGFSCRIAQGLAACGREPAA
jgi:hypothetical protein